MLIAAFGPASAFIRWCLNALNSISTVTLGEFDYISVNTMEDFKTAIAGRSSRHVLLYTNSPDQGLIEAFEKSKIPFLALEEDPADITSFIMRERQLDWKPAARLASLTFATTADLFTSPYALRIARHNRVSVGNFIEQVAEHLGLELHEDQFEELLRGLAPNGTATSCVEDLILEQIPHAMPIGQRPEISETDRPILDMLISSMRYDKDGKIPEHFSWPAELFIGKDGGNHLLRQPIDMTGPPRLLLYGPYLHIPFGVWEIILTLKIDENFSGNSVDIDIFHQRVLKMETFKLPASGVMALKAKFSIEESRHPVEIRMILREGAIEGKIQIADVNIYRFS